ncbi:hypothetical protein RHSIM_RhsimUnG0119300 [Rhododendron simsii]|uniref:DUF4220 domain-containing protein n=1 Tax=Rhododendron simsii TaxID=118357 RepID=A0A834FUV5_RHOSS|nr:hypothetical protein RHSIM_RhsimUnG0119300 [Rhododendron simsii]
MMGQLNLLDVWLNTVARDHGIEPDQKVVRKILRSLLGIKRWVEEYLEYRTLKQYIDKTVVPSLLFDRILNCCQRLTSPDLPPRRAVGEDLVWKEFFDRDSAVSQHTMPPSDLSLLWEENRELCKTLSRYMMYLLAMRPSLLPTSSSNDYVSDSIPIPKLDTDGLLDEKAACRCLWESDEFGMAKIIEEVQSKHKDERWDVWKLMLVRMLCYATSPVLSISSPDSRIGLPVFGPKSREDRLDPLEGLLVFRRPFNKSAKGAAISASAGMKRHKCVMDPIPALVRRLWDVWDLRLLVLLSLALQIILSLSSNRRKYISSPWISILIWSAYLMADWVATVALGKLSDAQADSDNGNRLRAIWAPLLLLHLGGPDTITAYSLEDNHLWMRHLLGLVVQLSVTVYVILMSWKHSWFSIMSIPALVAGFIKYGERTWVLFSVSRDKSGEIVPFGNVGSGSNLGNNSTLEDNNSIRALCIAQRSVKAFKEFTQLYDIKKNWLRWEMSLEHDDISLFWNAIEVEMGLMFDLLYTKAPINFRKGGYILRCITFSCTMAVLIGLILRFITIGEDRQTWHKVDIAITEVLLVGVLALEIYAILSLYLFSDWGMLWLIKHNRGKQVIQLRKKISWLFLPKQYRCKMMGQLDLLDYWLKKRTSVIEPDQKACRRILGSLLGIKRWLEEYFKDMFNKYVHKTADIVPSLLFDPILHCCRCLTSSDLHPRRAIEEDPVWKEFFNTSLEEQISCLYFATGICYNLETEWDTHDAADDQNNRDGIVSQQHTMPPSVLSSSWEDNRELCRTLSRYMMYLLVMRSSLLPIVALDDYVSDSIRSVPPNLGGGRDAGAACKFLWESDEFATNGIVAKAKSTPKDERWDILKLMWVLRVFDVASQLAVYLYMKKGARKGNLGFQLVGFVGLIANKDELDLWVSNFTLFGVVFFTPASFKSSQARRLHYSLQTSVMDPIPAWVRRLLDVWDLRLLVLLSLALQIILSLFGNRRKYISSPWISILVWSAYLMADWAATVALGKLSDAQGDNGDALKAMWAPLLLLHLGGPDTITAYSLEDNHLWMRHLFGLGVQFSVAVYVILMSWKHSWFSIMSIPGLVAGLIKYGERSWVLLSVSRDKSAEIVPFTRASNLGNNNDPWENKSSRTVLCVAHRYVRVFKKFMEFYDVDSSCDSFSQAKPLEFGDMNFFWKVIEVEMGLMFDLLYTKTPINFKKVGWILRCVTFSCTVTVLVGLIFRPISTGDDGDKWHKVDIAITEVLVVGALALEIYAIIALYLFSDWAMLCLIKLNIGKQIFQLRERISWLFLPKQYGYKTIGQVNLIEDWLKNQTSVIEPDRGVESDQKVSGRILRSLMRFRRWLEEYFKDMLKKYVQKKTSTIVPSLLFEPILHCCQCLTMPDLHRRRAIEEDQVWKEFFGTSLEEQIICLHMATEIFYNLEVEWDTRDAADQNSRDSILSQHHTMPPSNSSSSWEDNRELCRTLSNYMMYLLLMRPSFLPMSATYDVMRNINTPADLDGARDASAACLYLWETDEFETEKIVEHVKSKQKDVRWEMLKLVWVRMLCYAASKGQRNEHLRQLTQGVWARRLWDEWDLRLLVLLSLALQIILSVFGNRRKYISSSWISILLWSAYLMADWVATVALGKLSDAEVNYDNGSALRAIWAPLLLLHLGGPDTITAYSLEDIPLWLRHLFGLVVQFFVAVYVILMSWKHSWFSIMSIPALVAGFIKYGERTWVLLSVSRDESGQIVPFGNVGSGSNLGDNNTLEDKDSIHGLCIAHTCVKAFKEFTEYYDMENNEFELENPIELDDISQFWKVIEVEMGLMFDLLYTKAPINFRKRGCILCCITFSCTVGVLIGLIIRLGEGGEKWHKVDIAITEALLVGALALEIYAIISLYLFSDWAMLWLIKNNKAEQVIQLRKIKSWLFFLPKEYRCKMVGQFDVIDNWVNKPDQKVVWSLLGFKRWLEEYFEDTLKKYVPKTAVIDPSLLFDPISKCRIHLIHPGIGVDPIWKEFFDCSLEAQIFKLHFATEVCYNLEMEWDTHDAVNQNNRDGTVSQQHTILASDSSSSWEGNMELCRTLSRYVIYLLFMRSSLLPIAASHDYIRGSLRFIEKSELRYARDVRAACRYFLESNLVGPIVKLLKSKQKDLRWEMLKWVLVRMLCHAASKGQRNEHFRQLSQGGEFLTFLWFFLPQPKELMIQP